MMLSFRRPTNVLTILVFSYSILFHFFSFSFFFFASLARFLQITSESTFTHVSNLKLVLYPSVPNGLNQFLVVFVLMLITLKG